MGSDILEEVDQFVGGVSSIDDESPKRRGRKVKALPPESEILDEPDEPDDDEVDEVDEEPPRAATPKKAPKNSDDDVADLLPKELPRPTENYRSLAGMMSKYSIGDSPEFRVQLHRLQPRFLPGGVQLHGYLDEFSQPIAEDYINSEFGGGQYEVRIMGPDAKHPPNGMRRYDSIKVEIAGQPNPTRLSRKSQAAVDQSTPTTPAPVTQMTMGALPMQPQENTSLANQAMKMAQEAANREREDRRRAEEKAAKASLESANMINPLVEAERRRADDVIKAERDRMAAEKAASEERIREERERIRRLEERIESMASTPQQNPFDALSQLLPHIKGDGGEAQARASEGVIRNILDRHKDEIAAMHQQHASMIDSMRQSHANEIESMRQSHSREMEAEREAGRNRESRHEDALRSEREQRTRDAESYKKSADERDRQWKDRMDSLEINLKTMWETRVETQKTNFESQITWMRSEIEQKDARIRAFESQLSDRGDVVKQLASLRDLRTIAKDSLGIEDQPAAQGGGIGLSGSGGSSQFDWSEVMGTVAENLPAILGAFGNRGAAPAPAPSVAPAPQPQQAPQVGQIIETEQGTMVVVRAPNGELALARKDQYEAARQQTTSRAVPTGPRARGILAPVKKPVSSGIPVPNMAEGLEKPRPWGEPVQPPMPKDAPPPPRAAAPNAAPATPAPTPQPGAMNPSQVMIAREVAKLIHVSVDNGDEPEEFVAKIVGGRYPKMIVDGIAAMPDDQVLAAIMAVEPNSAGATPMGQRFVRQALAALRAAI